MVAKRRRVYRADSIGLSIGPSTFGNRVRDEALDVVTRADESRQRFIDGDELAARGLAGTSSNSEVPPIYSFGFLDRIYKKSSMLPQCIHAMKTNIGGYGFRVVPIGPEFEGQMDPQEVDLLTSWIERVNPDQSFMMLQRKEVYYYEKYGFCMYEVVRNKQGVPAFIKEVNVSTMRATAKQKERVSIRRAVMRGKVRQVIVERKRFRKYYQHINGSKVWFKEWGDPRTMDWRTGEYQGRNQPRIPPRFQATEILHNKQDSEDTYGIPRWVSTIPSIIGSHEAEVVNVRYFQDNTIPPAILTVSGGRLTAESWMEIKRVIEQGGMGKQHQLMLLEAIAESEGIDDSSGNVKLQLEKLADSRQSDSLFGEYDDDNRNKVRTSFRLPPLIFGGAQETTFASAQVSVYLAELQVFQPERMIHDEFLNKNFVNNENGLGLRTCKLESKGPQLTQPENVIKALSAGNSMGAVTPRSAIASLNEHMQLSLPQYPEPNEEGYFEWMDQPLQFSLRQIGRNDNDVDRTREEEDMDEEGSETREAAREGTVSNTRQRRAG